MTSSIITHVSGLIFYSDRVQELMDFYGKMGVPLQEVSHGPTGLHVEGNLGGTHIAILKNNPHFESGTLVPAFFCQDPRSAEEKLQQMGANRVHKWLDIGEGKKVISFRDPDGRAFRLFSMESTFRE